MLHRDPMSLWIESHPGFMRIVRLCLIACTVGVLLGSSGKTQRRKSGPPECKAHHVRLRTDSVEIQYGLTFHPKEYITARDQRFPNSNVIVSGGCIFASDFPKKARVHYCAQCRQVEKEWTNRWVRDNPRPYESGTRPDEPPRWTEPPPLAPDGVKARQKLNHR